MGIFAGFVDDPDVRLWGVEASGHGSARADTAASLGAGTRRRPARLALVSVADARRAKCATRTRFPRASTIRASARSTRSSRTADARRTSRRPMMTRSRAFHRCAEREGIVPALEIVARARIRAQRSRANAVRSGLMLVNLSGRGDKDTRQVAALEAERAALGARVTVRERQPDANASSTPFAARASARPRRARSVSLRGRSRLALRRARCLRRSPRPAPMSSSSASPTAIRSPTVRRSRPPRSARSTPE